MNKIDIETEVHTPLAEHIRLATFYTGMGLVIIGVIALLYLGVTVLEIIDAPEKSGLVQWLVTAIDKKELVLSGSADQVKFELHASETLQYLFFGILGFVMVRILVSIVNSLVAGGVKLIILSSPDRKKKTEDNAAIQ